MGKRRAFKAGLIEAALAVGVVTAAVAATPRAATVPGADWTGFGGQDDAHYSPLAEISDRNIARLGLAWSFDIETGGASNTIPIAIDGILYFAAQYGTVHALDARTGKLLWQYDPETYKYAGEKMRSAWGSRGLAYSQGKVFVGTADGRLIALDVKTGKPVWTAQTFGKDDGRYISGAPWVVGDKVVIGHGGADFAPVRGYVTAYDVATGKQAWRFYTVPGDPAKGFENAAMAAAAKTWKGAWWKWGGGGTVWNAMAYDAKRGVLYIGTGNGAPWNQKIRSPGGGDNLFLCSIIALDAKTGKYLWHYQVNPGESWDYNAAMDIELATLTIDGKRRDVLLHAPKNGFFYVLDRDTGKLISARQFAKTVTWATGIDQVTGRPIEIPEARYPNGRPYLLFPSPTGAHAAEPMAFNPRSGLAYVNVIEQGRVYIDPPSLAAWRYTPGQVINTGTGEAPAGIKVPKITNDLLAWNPVTQKAAWRLPLQGVKNGGIATTAGNLVLQGEVTGQFSIYAADSGKKIWSFDAQTGVIAAPMTYMAGGHQYITVISGWRGSGPSGLAREWDYTQQKWRVLTFMLDGKATLPPADRTERPFVDDAAFKVNPAKAAHGAQLFGAHCLLCHGPGAAAGGMAPDLRKSDVPSALEALTAVVHDGALAPRGMPAFPEFTAADIEALQHYIRQRARVAMATGGKVAPETQAGPPRQD